MAPGIYELIVGSVALSVIHALIPNHWLPIVAISKAENWKMRESLWVTAITGLAHILTTILLGLLVGIIGLELTRDHYMFLRYVAPLILVALGIWYLYRSFHGKSHHHHASNPKAHSGQSKTVIVLTLTLGMVLSPHVEMIFYYLRAAAFGVLGFITVSIIYLVVPVMVMMLLVGLTVIGVERLKWHFLEQHEKAITGTILILLGIFSLVVVLLGK